MRLKLWVFISLCLHASLVAAAILYVTEKPVTPEPISIQMVSFAAEQPVSEPQPVVEDVTPPEPEPVVEPEPEPIPVAKPVIEKPIEKKPKPKPKPKPVERPKPPIDRPQPTLLKPGRDLSNLNPTAMPSTEGEKKPVTANTSGKGKEPNALRLGKPMYPPRAQSLGIEGTVKVRFDINEDGRVENIEIISAKPRNYFEKDVRSAMRHWRYEKIAYKGKEVIIDFKFDNVTFG